MSDRSSRSPGRMPSGRLWRLLQRLTGGMQLERLAAIEEKIGKFGSAQREELADQRRRLDQLAADLSTRASAESIGSLHRRVEDLQETVARQDHTLADALERARLFDEMAVDDRRFARRMEHMARRGKPIVVGPWTGEVGFELLYWVPFLRWVVSKYAIAPERLVVISRGGTASWYGTMAARYVDVFEHVTPEDFRAATEDAKKQRRVGAFDARLVDRVRAAAGLDDADLLHPGMMYRLFMPFWRQWATAQRVEAYTDYARLNGVAGDARLDRVAADARLDGVADDAIVRDLPADYVAARFYFSGCFPDTEANRAFVASTLEALARQHPVVLLNTPFAVDDHRDATSSSPRVISVAARMVPERNLALQTAVIAGARAFVGTYGGYSYLAPFCGVPSLAFFSDPTFKPHHLHLAQRVFARLEGPTVVPLDTAALPLVRLALNGVLAAAP